VNTGPYAQTEGPDRDPERPAPGPALALPFAPGDLDRVGPRMRQSDFARVMNVSKQTVSQWVKEGKITPRPDGLVDAEAAVRQLVRNLDPARLRVRLIAPVVAELRDARAREAELLAKIAALQAQLARRRDELEDDADFDRLAIDGLLAARGLFKLRVLTELDALAALPAADRAARLEDLDDETIDGRERAPSSADALETLEALERAGRECLSPRSPLEGEAGPFDNS
jgi:transcriptional regulator with XRE-family HTH domain